MISFIMMVNEFNVLMTPFLAPWRFNSTRTFLADRMLNKYLTNDK